MAEKKLSVITSPAFACCFTLFSLACTAVFVFSDHRPSAWVSSLSLLFPTATSSPHFNPLSSNYSPTSSPPSGPLSGNYSAGSVINGIAESGSAKGKLVSLTDSPATSSPPGGPLSGSYSDDSVNNGSGKGNLVNFTDSPATSSPPSGPLSGSYSADLVNNGSGKGNSANLPNSPATSLPVSGIQVRDPNGSVSGNYSADLLSNGNFESGSEKGNSVNFPDSPAMPSPVSGNPVGHPNGSVSGSYSSDLLNNGDVSEKGKAVNSTASGEGGKEDSSDLSSSLLGDGTIESGSKKGKMVNASLFDNQDKVSNDSVIGFLSNSSVSLLDKKDGHFRESYDKSRTGSSSVLSNSSINLLHNGTVESGSEKGKTVNNSSSDSMNQTVNSKSVKGTTVIQGKVELWEKMKGCDFFDGNWVKDDSYPLYKAGSCPHIDEPFDCFRNGRPDNDYEKFRWQPQGCNIPRLNGRDLLEMLRGKRLVYVGDSLNRNMWESMVCTLRNAVKDKRRVFEASGKRDFRTEHSYSFIFLDYNCSVEFFRSTFLVREWDVADTNGLKQETLRLDMVARSFDRFKDADILVFNTGHWWTHEKTARGKGYYQEGSHVYDELNVMEAFRRAMTTWGRWIDNNVNPKKTLVIFRGYSASHFSGGQWNSGGQCDSETVPIKNETYLKGYPSKMIMFEKVMSGMSTPVLLLNVTKMTDFRKDAHPSVYRSQHLTEEERKSPLRFQDCSHWCLPGIPETWNELLYAQIFSKYKL